MATFLNVCARTSGTQQLSTQGKSSGQLVCNVGRRSKRVSAYVCTHSSTVDSIVVACGERQSSTPLRPSVADVRAADASGGHRAFCAGPTVACHISGHRHPGSEQEATHDKGTHAPRHLHVQTRLNTCSLSVVAILSASTQPYDKNFKSNLPCALCCVGNEKHQALVTRVSSLSIFRSKSMQAVL